MSLPIIEVENDCGKLYARFTGPIVEDYFYEKYGPITQESYAKGFQDGYKTAMKYIREKTFD